MSIRKTIHSAMDLVFSLAFVGPLTVLYWRGTFNIVSDIAFRDRQTSSSKVYPALVLYFAGMIIKIFVDLAKHSLRDFLKESCLKSLTSLILLYLDSFFGVVMWAGGFNLLFALPNLHWYCLVCVLIITTGILMFIKAFNCTGETPLAIYTDEFENIFNPSNYFGTKLENKVICHWVTLDTVFSYSIVHTLVICCWWSMWELENRYILFPCEITAKDIEAWDSIIIALLLVFVIVCINSSIKEMQKEDGMYKKNVATNITAFMAFLASLNFWRGVWSLMDFYFFPSMNLWNNLVLSHCVGFLGSYLAGSSLTLTQSSEKDPDTPDFHSCNYWSKSGMCQKKNYYEDLDLEAETRHKDLHLEMETTPFVEKGSSLH